MEIYIKIYLLVYFNKHYYLDIRMYTFNHLHTIKKYQIPCNGLQVQVPPSTEIGWCVSDVDLVLSIYLIIASWPPHSHIKFVMVLYTLYQYIAIYVAN